MKIKDAILTTIENLLQKDRKVAANMVRYDLQAQGLPTEDDAHVCQLARDLGFRVAGRTIFPGV